MKTLLKSAREFLVSRAKDAQNGQTLIVFALIVVPVTLGIGVVAVDAGMWQSERRGAQKDADLSALAGAYELLDDSGSVSSAAKTAAASYGDTNDEASNASLIGEVVVTTDCFPGGTRPDSVTVDIDHDSRTFFGDAFGIAVPDIGAHARACAGSIVSRAGLRPYGIESQSSCGVSADPFMLDGSEKYARLGGAGAPEHHGQGNHPTFTPSNTPTRTNTPTPTNTRTSTPTSGAATSTPTPSGITATPTTAGATPTATGTPDPCAPVDAACFTPEGLPNFGAACVLDDGSLSNSTSQRGILDLERDGAACSIDNGNDLRDNVRYGSQATCDIGDIVHPEAGGSNGNDLQHGLIPLLSGSGSPAVADGSQCDPAFRTANPGVDDFDEVLERIDGGPAGPSPDAVYQLRACVSPRVIDLIVIDHFPSNPSGTATIVGFASFYIIGCSTDDVTPPSVPNRCDTGGPVGQRRLWGIFIKKVELGGDIGEFNPFGQNGIRLVE